MNEHCSQRVWEASNQKGAALLLLLAIAGEAATCFRLRKTGLASPTLQALARKTRLVAGLRHPGRILPRPGRRHHFILLAGAGPQLLAAALQEAAARAAAIDGLLDPTQDSLPWEVLRKNVED